MSDLDQFKQTFITEAFELLEDMEEKLLQLDHDNVDLEDINAIFRCAHSIKGGAGSFGLDRLVAFTHELEFLLDSFRNNEIPVTEEAVDALLRSVDVLNILIGAAQNGEEAEEGIETELKDQIKGLNDPEGKQKEELPSFSQPEEAKGDVPAEAKEEVEGDAYGLFEDAVEEDVSDSGEKGYKITFIPEKELFASGNEPLFIIRELCKLGETKIDVSYGELPDINELDPLDCYMSWSIDLKTFEDEEKISEVFEFVEDECKLIIEKQSDSIAQEQKQEEEAEVEAYGLFEDISEKPAEDDNAAYGLFDDNSAEVAEKPEQPSATETNDKPKVEVHPKQQVKKPTPAKPPAPAVSSIRVDINKIDRMVNMVGELVITQAMIMQRMNSLPQEYLEKLTSGVSELSRHTRELQEAVMSVRMQPVSSVFSRMPRIVRDLSKKLNKKVRIEMKGEATEIDKTVIEQLSDPLTHMIRNSVDHGIESPEERASKGKPEEGVVNLSADNSGGRIIIQISDDGAGVNRDKVLSKAIEKGVISEDTNLSPAEIDMLIFAPGFSTAEAVTDVSGRGVGMDVVRKNIKDLGGEVEMSSVPGEGSTFLISLPLTLAILDGMVVEVGVEKYIIPINNILETMQTKTSEINQVKNGEDVINVRGEFIPIVYLKDIFDVATEKNSQEDILIVLVETGRQKFGVVVDDLIGQQQVVIKNLEENSDPVEGVSGATILGDGNVSLILDVAQILKMKFDKNKLSKIA